MNKKARIQKTHLRNVVERIGPKRGDTMLFIGIGINNIAAEIFERHENLTVIDLLEIKDYPEEYDCGNKIEAFFDSLSNNPQSLAFQEANYDLIIVLNLIEHLRWDRWAVQELSSKIKPNEHLLLVVPDLFAVRNFLNLYHWLICSVEKTKKLLSRYLPDYNSKNTSTNYYRYSKIRNWLNGFHLHLIRKEKHNGNLVILAQKKDIPKPIEERDIFTNIQNSVTQFESKYKVYFSQLAQWLQKYPEFSDLAAQPIEEIISNTRASVLVLSPHPDDETIGCGGTLIKLIESGMQVTVIQLTTGRNSAALRGCPEGYRESARLEESRKAARLMGISDLILWDNADSKLECSNKNVDRLTRVLDDKNPQFIFVPFLKDNHKDHVTTNKILSKSLLASKLILKKVLVFSYEVWGFLPPNCISVIDDHFDRKIECIMQYRIAMKAFDYIPFCERLNSYRAITQLKHKGFAEAFFYLTAGHYVELAKKEIL